MKNKTELSLGLGYLSFVVSIFIGVITTPIVLILLIETIAINDLTHSIEKLSIVKTLSVFGILIGALLGGFVWCKIIRLVYGSVSIEQFAKRLKGKGFMYRILKFYSS